VGESFAVVPIPLRVTFCGLPAALSLMLSAAVRVPDAVGLNVILMLQLAAVANELPHVWVCAKSLALVPVTAIAVMLKVVLPMLVSTTVFAELVLPMATVPKFKLLGESFAVVPIPLNVTFCGLPVELSVMARAALRVPEAVGVNLTLIVQLAPTAIELPQVVVREKSPAFVPVIAIAVIVNVAVPVSAEEILVEGKTWLRLKDGSMLFGE
jgi:hypothetical protein